MTVLVLYFLEEIKLGAIHVEYFVRNMHKHKVQIYDGCSSEDMLWDAK